MDVDLRRAEITKTAGAKIAESFETGRLFGCRGNVLIFHIWILQPILYIGEAFIATAGSRDDFTLNDGLAL